MKATYASLAQSWKVLRYIWSHPSNRGKRVRAIISGIRFQTRARLLGKRTLAPLGEHSYIWAELHRTSSSNAVYANPPHHPEMLVWAQRLQPGRVFVDIGANVGVYTLWASELGARVISVEPGKDTYELLRENVELNGYSVELVRAAVGAENGTIRFTSGLDCLNRIDPTGSEDVEIVTLDNLLGELSVTGLKIDVEGYELDVLRGGVSSLATGRIELIQLEWNDSCEQAVGSGREPVADLLASFGYALFRPDDVGGLRPTDRYPAYGPDVFAMRPIAVADAVER